MSARLIFPFAAAALLAACQSGSPAASAATTTALPTEGSHWRLVSGLDGKLPPTLDITLEFGADGRIGGNGGCNRYNAVMTLSNDRLEISPVAATKRACMGEGGGLEAQYFSALSQVTGLSLDGNALRLGLEDGGELRFAPASGKVDDD
ncbi:MAG: META domain-containing protein [Xanthomonadales bacterium]|nr:META domain-containing protein [Xanthomonadales bacterium]